MTKRAPKVAELSNETICATALELIDGEGLAEFSTRKLGRVLGCEAMAIYNHFPSKDALLDAVVEATEEAVLTSMLAAPIVVGRDGNTSPGLPAARVRALLATAGRC